MRRHGRPQILEFFQYYNTISCGLCYNKENSDPKTIQEGSMNAVISIILLAVALGAIVLLLTRRENTHKTWYPQRDRRVRLRVPPRK